MTGTGYSVGSPSSATITTNLSISIEAGDDSDLDVAYTRSESPHYYQFELHRSTSRFGTYSLVRTVSDSISPADFDNQTKDHWYKARGRNCATSARTACGDWSAWSNSIDIPPDPTIDLYGLVTSMTEGDNDSFTVSASNLVSTHSYTIRVETNNSDVGFNSSCSDRQEEVTVPSGRTSYSTTFTLYGCDTSGGTVTATLRRGTTSVDTDSQYVGVTAPSIEIRNLATTLQEGQSDSFLVWASNLNTSHLYTFQVETDNSDIGFNATCSIRSRTQSVPSSSTSESAGFTLHACDASGGRATATLLRGGTTVDTDYQDVIVPSPAVFQFTPSPLALGGTSNVWTIPTGVTSVYVDVDFSEGIYKDEDAGDINVNRVNSFGTVLSTLAVDNEDDSRTWTGAADGSLIRIDVDNDAFDVSLALVTLTFHSGSDTTGPEIARATVQKESRPYAPTNGSASVDETNGSVTLSWGPGAARLGSNPDHYEVVIPDATNPSTPLYSNLNVDDSTTPTTLTISNARALGLEGSHTAEVRHCNAAGGCSLPLNITFMVTQSIALLGVGASLEVDASDQFSVSVRRLNPSHNYLIRVVYTTSHIAEDSGCLGGSTNTIRNFSGSTTFYLSTFNVYGCSAGTSTITANLHRVISGVEQVSSLATAVAPVSVITPNPPAAPTDLTGGVGDRGISLSWPAPSGTVTGYKVQRRVDTIGTSFSTITTLNGKDSTTHTDGDAALVEGTSYLYRVIAFNSGGDSQPSDDVTVSFKIITSEWNVLDYRYVLIDWLLPSNQRTTGHQFRFGILRTGGADAGFQIYPATATNARKCNWSSPPSDYTSWSNLGTAFYVVRCKLGTGNGHIELQRIPDSGSSRPITSILTIGPVKQSWHRADHQVGYLVDSPFMDGAKPGHLPAAYTWERGECSGPNGTQSNLGHRR